MRNLTAEEIAGVSGGNKVYDFIVGYLGGKILDAGVRKIANDAENRTIVPVYGTTQYNGTYFNVPNSHELAQAYM